jgi:hypothetical protein
MLSVSSLALALGLFLLAILAGGCGQRNESLKDTLDPAARPHAADASRAADAAGVDAEVPPDEADALARAEAAAADADLAGCGASGSIMYLLEETGVLRTFDPALAPTGSPFRNIGPIVCTLTGGTAWTGPVDMGMDRTGVVWINGNQGHLFQWDPGRGRCRETMYQGGQGGFTKMSLAFVGRADGTETLFVVDNANGPASASGQGLATIDLMTLRLMLLANFAAPLTGRVAELAGTENGHLYGFFFGSQSWIAEIDPSNAQLLWNTPLPLPSVGSGPTHVVVAAALWGTVLYFFITNTAVAPSADVYAFDLTTRQTRPVLSQIGFNVTGAVVRMCGPTPSSG